VHLLVKIDHVAYVHTVDMVGAKDRYQMSIEIVNQVKVLVNCVGSAAVPRFIG